MKKTLLLSIIPISVCTAALFTNSVSTPFTFRAKWDSNTVPPLETETPKHIQVGSTNTASFRFSDGLWIPLFVVGLVLILITVPLCGIYALIIYIKGGNSK